MLHTPILYVIASPIGNLSDISARALEILSAVPVIAAEDTRRTRTLLSAHGISGKNVLSLRAHNENKAAALVVKKMTESGAAAYLSDAGTPGISDPGAKLVRAVRVAGFGVSPVPGASALSALVSVSGCENAIHFFGFAPRAGAARTRFFNELKQLEGGVVLFEAPARIADALKRLNDALGGQTRMVLGREMTKMHEQVLEMSLAEMIQAVEAGDVPERGEFALFVESPGQKPLEAAGDELFEVLVKELPPRKAAQIAAKFSGVSAGEYYKKRLAGKK